MRSIKRFLQPLLWLCLAFASVAFAEPQGRAPLNSIDAVDVARQGGVVTLKFSLKSPASVPASFSIASPARIALDFAGTANGLGRSSQNFNEGDLRSINVVQVGDRTRVVLNLSRNVAYETRVDGSAVFVTLTPPAKAETTAAAETPTFAAASASAAKHAVRDIAFRRGKNGEGRIVVELADASTGIDIRQQGGNLIVDFLKTALPENLRRRLDVTDFATPVTSVATVSQGDNVRMTISAAGMWEHNAYQTDNQFVVEVKPVVEDPNKLVQGGRAGYKGEKLSLNFQNVDVRRLLQVIGEFTGLNVVVSDSVGGSITLILKDVPWDQALDIILQQKGLDMRKNGNVIMIAPRDEIAAKEKLEFEARQQIGDLEPLRTESFQLNFATASVVARTLAPVGGGAAGAQQRLLSKRGTVSYDDRTNLLFVQDTVQRLDEVRALIAKIDVPTRQVLIEARIVEADDSFGRSLGVRLGAGDSTVRGSPLGGTNARYRISGSSPNQSTMDLNGINVNLPTTGNANSSAAPGTFGLWLFNSDMTRVLNLEISALESDGRGKVVSSPRVLTADKQSASIKQGFEVPYTSCPQGAGTVVCTTSFKEALLSLEVKPMITPDGRVTVELTVKKDEPKFLQAGSTAGPPLDRKEVRTTVRLENGGTVVIGGVFVESNSNTVDKIPFLGDIPLLGALFRTKTRLESRKELLVFITPRVVDERLDLK